MTKLMAMVAASMMLCGGCADGGDIPLHCWEYQASLPAETPTEALAETEARLRSNGYVRVVFRNAFNEWTGRPTGIIVFATRTPGKEADDGGGR